MDTKSRNIRYSSGFKLLALLLCAAGMMAMAWGLRDVRSFPDAAGGGDYRTGHEYAGKIEQAYRHLEQAAFLYKSEENILAGGCIEEGDMRWENDSAKGDYEREVARIRRSYAERIADAQSAEDTAEEARLAAVREEEMAQAKDDYDRRLADIRDRHIRGQLGRYREHMNYLAGTPGLCYYARSPGGAAFTNIGGQAGAEAFFKALPTWFSLQPSGARQYTSSPDIESAAADFGMPVLPKGAEAWVGFSQQGVDALCKQYDDNRNAGTAGIYRFGAGLLAFLLGMGWLLWAAGRRPGEEGVRLLPIDRVWLDVSLVVIGLAIAACVAGLYQLYWSVFNGWFMNMALAHVLGGALAACAALLAALWFTSAARRAKRGEFFKHTLIYSVIALVVRVARRLLDAGPLVLKWTLAFAGYAFASSLFLFGTFELSYPVGRGITMFLLFFATQAALCVFLFRKAAALKAILLGTQKIKSGSLGHRIEPAGGKPFTDIAENVNNIASGLNAAVEDRVRAERMKAELVTNVSHDLKTPLTSILTYIDLLKKEGPGSENAPGYVEVLDAKARRLKSLTDDLFEAAKAASGSIVPMTARVDVRELLSQGLGELADRLRESGLDFRVSMAEGPLCIQADGRLLWRVVENLLSNVFKYAMPGSRVYVSAGRAQGNVRIEMKNISAYELNIPASELTERFTRGDESRGSEGSGLGLAIAKSLTELQGGAFRVEVDGDLFKASVEFKEDV